MKTVVVAGARSNIGKTMLAERILRRFPDWAALKITTKRDSRCPRNSSCQVCDGFKGDFDIIVDREIILQEGTDTARLKKAGAKKVIWLKATSHGLKSGVKAALSMLKDTEGVVIEGGSVLNYLSPDLTIYIKDKGKSLKPSSNLAERKADIVVKLK